MNTLLDSRTPEERRDDSKITSVTTSSADTLTEQEMVNKDGYYPYEVRILNNLLKRTSLSSNTKAEIIFALREEMKPLISTIKSKAVEEENSRIKEVMRKKHVEFMTKPVRKDVETCKEKNCDHYLLGGDDLHFEILQALTSLKQ